MEKRIVSPLGSAERMQNPPRIARPVGQAALEDITEPIGVPRIEARGSAEEERKQYLETIFSMPDPTGKDRYGRAYAERTSVTADSEADAAYAYRFVDGDIKDMIAPFKNDAFWKEEHMPELLRTNDELRIALGTHLIEKFSSIYDLPERVAANSPDQLKSPGHPGYPDKMLSRDYAALLALSMLDGTFKKRPDSGDTSQHRTAAQKALGIYGQLKSDEAWNRTFQR